MTFADHDPTTLVERAGGAGIEWDVGPFRMRLRTDLADVVSGVAGLYREHHVADRSGIADVEVVVHTVGPLARKVTLRVDGEPVYADVPRRLAVPLLEWTFNVTAFQRPHQFFLLHSAVVERDGRALLLPGRAGSGKSTLCAALVHRGWRLLSDEVAPIRPEDLRVVPVPRPISLKEDSIDAIRRFAPGADIGPSWSGTFKGTVAHVLPPRDSVERAGEPAVPAWILFPRFEPDRTAEIEAVPKARALLSAADDTFNYSVLGATAFETLSGTIDRCSCASLRFGDLGAAAASIDAWIEGTTADGP